MGKISDALAGDPYLTPVCRVLFQPLSTIECLLYHPLYLSGKPE
jgi:hypothetical protein